MVRVVKRGTGFWVLVISQGKVHFLFDKFQIFLLCSMMLVVLLIVTYKTTTNSLQFHKWGRERLGRIRYIVLLVVTYKTITNSL